MALLDLDEVLEPGDGARARQEEDVAFGQGEAAPFRSEAADFAAHVEVLGEVSERERVVTRARRHQFDDRRDRRDVAPDALHGRFGPEAQH